MLGLTAIDTLPVLVCLCISDDELTNMAETQRKNDEAAKKEAEERFKKNAAELKANEKQQSEAQAKAEKAQKAKEAKEKKEKARIMKAKKAEEAAKNRAEQAENAAKLKAEKAAALAARKSGRTDAADAQASTQGQGGFIDEAQAMKNLADEEAELLRCAPHVFQCLPTAAWVNVLLVVDRRLASGELSPEEEAAVRARLKAIEAERASLLSAAAAERDAKLAALDDEEAELLRRLESGELTPGKPANQTTNVALQHADDLWTC